MQAHRQQIQRQGCTNAHLGGTALEEFCRLGKTEKLFLEDAMEQLNLSARALHRTLRVARTIADLDAVSTLNQEHLGEALGYRNPEFKQ